jgi:CRP/FNR family transcriptional regulator, cyclic AMP receptor protein
MMPRRSKAEKIGLLKGVPLLWGCSEKELGRIAALVAEREVASGTALTREGQPGSEFFVVVDGNATVTLRGKKLATFGPGSFFGEMSLLDHGPCAATVTADSTLHVLTLDPQSFFDLLEDVPSVARKVIRVLAERLRSAEKAPTH